MNNKKFKASTVLFMTLLLQTSKTIFSTIKRANSNEKIILCTFFTPSHEGMAREWLFSTIQDDFEMIIGRASQECPTATYYKESWTKTTRKKVLHIIDTIKKNMGRIMIFADADITLFGPVRNIINNLLTTNDIVIQKDDPQGNWCTGFFAQRCNYKILDLWEKVYHYMLTNKTTSDQRAFKHIFKKINPDIAWSYLPISSFMGGATFTGKGWSPGDELFIPEDILMFHANHVLKGGVTNKIAMLEYVSKIVKAGQE